MSDTTEAPTLPEIGKNPFGSRYEFLGILGRGGMGTVYRVMDHELDEMIAIKVLRQELLSSPELVDRFRREVRLARRVTHHNVARSFDIGEHEGTRFLTMEFIDGEALSQLLRRERPLALASVVAMATQVCEGLAAAHAVGIVHRDLKPDNILLTREGRIVITDFGIARALLDGGSAENSIGRIIGTPTYMAPEQVEGSPDIDGRTDIYSLGCVLYELFTGVPPWQDRSPYLVATARIQNPPPDPRDRRADIPVEAAALVMRCMARNPEVRFQHARELEAALTTLGRNQSDPAPDSLLLGALSESRASSAPQMSGRILLIDDDDELRELLDHNLRELSYTVSAVASGVEALNLVRERDFDVILTDIGLRGMNGIELCSSVSGIRPGLPVIMLTGHGTIDMAIAAIRAGAYDFIVKPVAIEPLLIALNRAIGHHRLGSQVRRLREMVQGRRVDQMIGDSPGVRRVFDLIDRVAASDTSVLITGESGVGKELVARALHARSRRQGAPFVAVNCAAVSPSLIESELFGHARGAFTDAKQAHAGLFVQAEGGTLFLDEIGEMPMEMQTKLLRALQEHVVRPVGGDAEVPFDVRLISATSRDLDAAIEENRFRADFYYRINVVLIPVPPLRARTTDILLLAQHFLAEQAARSGKPVDSISTAAARKLLEYDWPGNVRELENCIERAVALARFSEIGTDDLPDKIRLHQSTHIVIDTTNPEELVSLAEMERRYVQRVLMAVRGNKTQAARLLGLDRRSFYRRLDRLHIADPEGPEGSS